MIEILLIYALLTTAMYYLGSRAMLTQALWSRYPPALAAFADCAACSGTWYGAFVCLADRAIGYPATPQGLLTGWYAPVVVGLCSMVWTPILAAVQQMAFERLGSAVQDDGPPA